MLEMSEWLDMDRQVALSRVAKAGAEYKKLLAGIELPQSNVDHEFCLRNIGMAEQEVIDAALALARLVDESE